MYHLDDEDMAWRTKYESGDTILFKCKGSIDTMIIERSVVDDTYLSFIRSEASDIFHARIIVEFGIKHNGQLLECRYTVTKGEDKSLAACWVFHERFAFFEDQSEVPLKKIVCKGESYDDVVVLDTICAEYFFAKPNPIPWEYFAWSKSKGLIQYKYQNSETYSLYKILPNKMKKGIL